MNKVKKAFIDKFTKKKYKKGDPYICKDEKRVAFLIAEGFLEKAEEPKKKATKKAEK